MRQHNTTQITTVNHIDFEINAQHAKQHSKYSSTVTLNNKVLMTKPKPSDIKKFLMNDHKDFATSSKHSNVTKENSIVMQIVTYYQKLTQNATHIM